MDIEVPRETSAAVPRETPWVFARTAAPLETERPMFDSTGTVIAAVAQLTHEGYTEAEVRATLAGFGWTSDGETYLTPAELVAVRERLGGPF